MKKKQSTFADRAKAIKKKYSRADFDEIERKDMLKELRALRDEQEQFRIDNGLDMEDQEEQQEFAPGGPYTGPTKINPFSPVNINTTKLAPNANAISPSGASPTQYRQIQSSALPFAVSALSSGIGNIAGMISARDQGMSKVSLPKMAAEQINLEPERVNMQRNYANALNIGLANSRNVGNPANAYANQISMITGLTDSLGSGQSQSYMNETNTNAQFRQQANQANQQTKVQEILENNRLAKQYTDTIAGYRDALSGVIPQALSDYRAQKSQDTWMSSMGKDYGLYEPIPTTFMEKFKSGMFGPSYRVLGRRNPNIVQ